MTYNVFSGTLNPTQSINPFAKMMLRNTRILHYFFWCIFLFVYTALQTRLAIGLTIHHDRPIYAS